MGRHFNDVIVHFKDQIEQAGRLPKDDDELFSSGYDLNRFLLSTLLYQKYFFIDLPGENVFRVFFFHFVRGESVSAVYKADIPDHLHQLIL